MLADVRPRPPLESGKCAIARDVAGTWPSCRISWRVAAAVSCSVAKFWVWVRLHIFPGIHDAVSIPAGSHKGKPSPNHGQPGTQLAAEHIQKS